MLKRISWLENLFNLARNAYDSLLDEKDKLLEKIEDLSIQIKFLSKENKDFKLKVKNLERENKVLSGLLTDFYKELDYPKTKKIQNEIKFQGKRINISEDDFEFYHHENFITNNSKLKNNSDLEINKIDESDKFDNLNNSSNLRKLISETLKRNLVDKYA